MTAASSTFVADVAQTYVTTRVGIGTTTPSSLYLLQVTNDGDAGVVMGSGGSMTAKTLAVTGTATVTGTLTASNDVRIDTNTLVVDAAVNRVGIGTTTPSTELNVIGTATVSGGVIIGDGTAIAKVLSATASLDFLSTAAKSSTDLTMTVTGAALGDVVAIGVPNGSTAAGSDYFGWVSAADTVTIRFGNYNNTGSIDPAAGTFRAMVIKF